MEYGKRDRDSSHRRHNRHSHHGHAWDGDHADHHEYHNWAVKKVRFRSRSSPPPPLSMRRHGSRRPPLDNGGWLDQDDLYSTWDKPVVFAPEEASYRPQKWLEKLEKLEAQVVKGSAQPGSALHVPIPDSHILRVQREELHDLRPVLVGVRENLRALQQAHYCSQTINLLVLEKARKEVVRLVEVTITVIQTFIGKAIRFVDRDDILSLSESGWLLGYCADILAWMEIRPRSLQQFRVDEMGGGRVRSAEYYEREWGRGVVTSTLVHALRATAYILDIAVVSFVGAHLEPFDEVYFRRDHRHHESRRQFYKIPCDEHSTSSILVYPRQFDCLSGFLGQTPAWVFEAHERGQVLDLGRLLYLRTSPEQLANVWGPVWRAETAEKGGASRFMLSKGFLIGWHHSSARDPPMYEGEYFCHWTDDPSLLFKDLHPSAGLPRYINIHYLLIGAHTIPHQHPALELNKHCHTTSTETYHQLQQHHELTNLGSHFAEWYLGPSNIPISVDPPGGFLGYGTELVFKRRQGTSCREAVCSKLVAQPWKYLGLLGDLYGVSISGCTGNAQRVRLLDVVLCPTMREFVGCQLPWVHDSDKWHYFRDLLLWNSSSEDKSGSPDYVHISKHTTESQRYDYARYLKLAVGAIKDLPISSASDHIDAIYAYHGSEYRVRISPGESECGWLGLLNDSLTSFSAPVVDGSSCLECRPGNIFCHHYHHHNFHHRYHRRNSGSGMVDDDEHYYLAPPRQSGSSIRSPSVASTKSVGSHSSRRSSFSGPPSAMSPRRSHSSHSAGHASHGYGTVMETTILVNPHAFSPSIVWPASFSHRDRYYQHDEKGKDKEYYRLHDWNYMEYMDWRQSIHATPCDMSDVSRAMVKAYPKGTAIDVGDAGELSVLGHLLVTTVNHWRGQRQRRGSLESASRSRMRSTSSRRNEEKEGEEEEVILVVERRRPKERMPRTVKYFLEKVNDPKVLREFHHGELVRLDDVSCHARCVYTSCDDDGDDNDEVVIIEEESEGDDKNKAEGRKKYRSRSRSMERGGLRLEHGNGNEVIEEEEEELANSQHGMGAGIVTGAHHEVLYPELTRLSWPGRLLHVLVVSDVHDGLVSDWVRELEVGE
ncbi:hypothetical protein V8F20_003153 [Naviculisporaceae sp. PSN 640]